MINKQLETVTFFKANKDFFKGYFDFKGRTTRAGYWWTVPLQLIAGIIFAINFFSGRFTLALILFIVIIIPIYAVLVRRFRDVGLTNKGIIIFLLLPLFLSWLLPNASSTTINIVTYIIAALPTDHLLTTSTSKFALFFARPI